MILADSALAVCSGEKLARTVYENIELIQNWADDIRGAEEPLVPGDMRHDDIRACFLNGNVIQYGPGVFAVRYLSEDYCAQLLKVLNTVEFTPNEEEPEDAQIPEVVIKHHHYGLHECLRGLHNGYIVPLTTILFGQTANQCTSIQAAKYTPENTPMGCWHTDQDSEMTLVVALSNDHEGGGTEVYQGPFADPVVVPQLPVGWGMLFNGRHNPHRGLPVTEGERNLLVHWFKFED